MLFETRQAIQACLAQVPRLAPAAEDIAATARLCVEFTPDAVCDPVTVPIGTSRLGGLPDLPKGIAWPEWQFPEGDWRIEHLGKSRVALRFLAQIDLGALPSEALRSIFGVEFPSFGRLWFFQSDMAETEAFGLDRSDRGATKVIWSDAAANDLARVKAPDGLEIYPAAYLHPQVGWALPATDVYSEKHLPPLEAQGLFDQSQPEDPQYWNGWDNMAMLLFDNLLDRTLGYRSLALHQKFRLGGWSGRHQDREFRFGPDFDPPIINGRPSFPAPGVLPEPEDWRPLFTFGWFEPSAMSWGDLDLLCVYIRQADLLQRDFSHAWGLECAG